MVTSSSSTLFSSIFLVLIFYNAWLNLFSFVFWYVFFLFLFVFFRYILHVLFLTFIVYLLLTDISWHHFLAYSFYSSFFRLCPCNNNEPFFVTCLCFCHNTVFHLPFSSHISLSFSVVPLFISLSLWCNIWNHYNN